MIEKRPYSQEQSFGPKYEIAKQDVVVFQAMLHDGKKLCFRN